MKRLLVRTVHRLPRWVRRFLGRLPGATRLRSMASGRPGGPDPRPESLRPVVYLPTWITWDSMRQRPQYLLAAFAAAGHPVYLVDPRTRVERLVDGVRVVPSVDSVPGRDVILYVHFAPVRVEFDKFADPVVVYDILDDLTIYDADEVGLPDERRVRFHHPTVMASADVVTASSSVLRERHLVERDDILLVENGVEAARFGDPRPLPSDLPAGRPIIGYHGALAPWVDFGLIDAVARAHENWTFVFVGPVDPESTKAVADLDRLPNVHFLGERGSDDMPGYVQAFDVGVVWFQVNQLTEAVSPLKLYEYLAAGTPAVSTPLPACVGVASVAIASTPTEVAEAIAKALDSADTDGLRSIARSATWTRRLEPVLKRLEELDLRTVPR